jgi:hypothetical protein
MKPAHILAVRDPAAGALPVRLSLVVLRVVVLRAMSRPPERSSPVTPSPIILSPAGLAPVRRFMVGSNLLQ